MEDNLPSQIRAKRLGEIAEKYGDCILRTCFLYLNNMTLAEDALQDTFLRIYENLDSFRQDSSEKTWITRIAINICKDYQKSNWHSKVNVVDQLKDIPCDDYHEYDDTVLKSVMSLPAKYKEVILLYYYQEFKIAEIAALLSIPKSTVGNRLSRARKKLKLVLDN